MGENTIFKRIPKLIVGNPDQAGLAVDCIPDYFPQRAAGVCYQENEKAFYYRKQKLPLKQGDCFLLAQCDGKTSIFQIVRHYVQQFDLEPIRQLTFEVP